MSPEPNGLSRRKAKLYSALSKRRLRRMYGRIVSRLSRVASQLTGAWQLSLRFLEKRAAKRNWFGTTDEEVVWERWELSFTLHPLPVRATERGEPEALCTVRNAECIVLQSEPM